MTTKELVDALLARKWTQQQIADRVGVQQSTVSKIARGDVSDVMSRTYLALLALYEEVVTAEPKAAA